MGSEKKKIAFFLCFAVVFFSFFFSGGFSGVGIVAFPIALSANRQRDVKIYITFLLVNIIYFREMTANLGASCV